jgi:hypothetical protein
MESTSPKYGLDVRFSASMISSRRASMASASPATSSSRRPVCEAVLSISWMSAPSWLRLDAMPPTAVPAPIHSGVPGVSTSSCLTSGDVVASRVAIAAVATSTPSIGMAGYPWRCAQVPPM